MLGCEAESKVNGTVPAFGLWLSRAQYLGLPDQNSGDIRVAAGIVRRQPKKISLEQAKILISGRPMLAVVAHEGAVR